MVSNETWITVYYIFDNKRWIWETPVYYIHTFTLLKLHFIYALRTIIQKFGDFMLYRYNE